MKNVEIIEMETLMRIQDGELPEDTILNTWNGWKKLGYAVKKGEVHVAEFRIWMPSKKRAKAEEAEENESGEEVKVVGNRRFYKKLSFFFTQSQVEPMRAK